MSPHYFTSEAEVGPDLFYNYRMVIEDEKDLEVRKSRGKGLGLFALHNITAGA